MFTDKRCSRLTEVMEGDKLLFTERVCTYLVWELTCWIAKAVSETIAKAGVLRAAAWSARLSSRARKQMMSTMPILPTHRHKLSLEICNIQKEREDETNPNEIASA